MRKIFCLSLLMLLLYATSHSQDNVISGKVTGTDKTPLQGVTVSVAGTKTQTITNADGTYFINVPGDATELTFTYVNAKSVKEKISGRKVIDIQMLTESVQLGEVIVVGYGTQKKANLTGAVDQVTSEVLENRSIPNLTQGLQGVLPNLNIRMLDGKPNQAPRFNIRGATSIGQGGSALVLIDGVEGDPSIINPNDVESVSILKDAASASIYGARGAFGVVLITTKNPAKGKTSITYSANFSTKEPTNVPSFANDAYTFAKMFAESSVAWDGSFPQAINKT